MTRPVRQKALSLLLILCLLLISLTACKQTSTTNAPPPPFMIRTLDKFETALAAATLNDNELENFLDNSGYDSEFHFVTEYRRFINTFSEIGYPKVVDDENFKNFNLEYWKHSGDYRFTLVIDETIYEFIFKFYRKTFNVGKASYVGTYRIDDMVFDMYRNEENRLFGLLFYSGNYQISIAVRGDYTLEDINFEEFTWQKAQ